RTRLRGREAVSRRPMAMNRSRRPILIEHIRPLVEDGRYPVKREVGDRVDITADIVKEGHDVLAAVIRYRAADEADWREGPPGVVDNDGWAGSFLLARCARYVYTIEAWTDVFGSWAEEMARRIEGGQIDLTSELLEGQALVQRAEPRARPHDAAVLVHTL